jgi:hypothetical protein
MMSRTLFTACFIILLGLSSSADAQLRNEPGAENGAVRVMDYGDSGFSMSKYFSPAHFRMSHSFEFSSGSFGGGSSVGMYTNSMMWQFSSKLAARADVAFAYSPDGGNNNLNNVLGNNNGRVFVKNAEIAYRPTENMQINISYRQNPYGGYGYPGGYGGYGGQGRYGYGSGGNFGASFGSESQNLFWNNNLR